MVRSTATNQTGWVVEEFKVVEGSKEAHWVAITEPSEKTEAQSQLINYVNQNPNKEFRVYVALTEKYKK